MNPIDIKQKIRLNHKSLVEVARFRADSSSLREAQHWISEQEKIVQSNRKLYAMLGE